MAELLGRPFPVCRGQCLRREGVALRSGVPQVTQCSSTRFWCAHPLCPLWFLSSAVSVRNKASTNLSLLLISLGPLLTCCRSYQNTQRLGKVKEDSTSAESLVGCAWPQAQGRGSCPIPHLYSKWQGSRLLRGNRKECDAHFGKATNQPVANYRAVWFC